LIDKSRDDVAFAASPFCTAAILACSEQITILPSVTRPDTKPLKMNEPVSLHLEAMFVFPSPVRSTLKPSASIAQLPVSHHHKESDDENNIDEIISRYAQSIASKRAEFGRDPCWMYNWILDLGEWHRADGLKHGVDLKLQSPSSYHGEFINSPDDYIIRIREKLAQLQVQAVKLFVESSKFQYLILCLFPAHMDNISGNDRYCTQNGNEAGTHLR
jgi:hypothetical protein